eukprot:CAMPEP_0175314804 /NCGR_PEP_ID=MMETSP0093-20121207/68578_1 /TAXON_ID=311494 /ORGANISM="Alexandrium monilatum, Strain CCMP3105" /LENGTH=136 /DNA_ID=CAMNT_0016611533 /DNA_START=55 /DNA_END=466 /DNA_ORIENTATION=-
MGDTTVHLPRPAAERKQHALGDWKPIAEERAGKRPSARLRSRWRSLQRALPGALAAALGGGAAAATAGAVDVRLAGGEAALLPPPGLGDVLLPGLDLLAATALSAGCSALAASRPDPAGSGRGELLVGGGVLAVPG